MDAEAQSLLDAWFGSELESPEAVEALCDRWFSADPSFDALLRRHFAELPQRAHAGELDAWREKARSSVALVIALDQLPRNLHRGTSRAFAYDAAAVDVAGRAIADGVDARVQPLEAMFLYLPFEHAEEPALQARSVACFRALVQRAPAQLVDRFESFVSYALRHQAVIERFGRFPHRNEALGRASTPAERRYLAEGGDRF